MICQGAAADQAREAGAEIVGGQELIQSIIENELKFDRVIATPELMPHVNKIARYLGPMGLMPTVKKGLIYYQDTWPS